MSIATTSAVALYERLGFVVHNLDIGYGLDVHAAPGVARAVTSGDGTKG